MGNVVYCEKCHEEHKKLSYIQLPGYKFPDEFRKTCYIHGTPVVDIGMPTEEGNRLSDAVTDSTIFEEMVQLWKDGSEEYEIRLKKYSSEAKIRKQKDHEQWIIDERKRYKEEQEKKCLVKCPYCGSTRVRKLSGRLLSAYFFGLGSRMIGKEWACNKCDSYF